MPPSQHGSTFPPSSTRPQAQMPANSVVRPFCPPIRPSGCPPKSAPASTKVHNDPRGIGCEGRASEPDAQGSPRNPLHSPNRPCLLHLHTRPPDLEPATHGKRCQTGSRGRFSPPRRPLARRHHFGMFKTDPSATMWIGSIASVVVPALASSTVTLSEYVPSESVPGNSIW